jgi:hypothetical protein
MIGRRIPQAPTGLAAEAATAAQTPRLVRTTDSNPNRSFFSHRIYMGFL